MDVYQVGVASQTKRGTRVVKHAQKERGARRGWNYDVATGAVGRTDHDDAGDERPGPKCLVQLADIPKGPAPGVGKPLHAEDEEVPPAMRAFGSQPRDVRHDAVGVSSRVSKSSDLSARP